MRWNLHASDDAKACPSVVLPTPGTSSIRRWPSASNATIARSIVCCFPFMVFAIASRRTEIFSPWSDATVFMTFGPILARGQQCVDRRLFRYAACSYRLALGQLWLLNMRVIVENKIPQFWMSWEVVETELLHFRIRLIGSPLVLSHPVKCCHDTGPMPATLAVDKHRLRCRICYQLE